jgi:hypothetical protein
LRSPEGPHHKQDHKQDQGSSQQQGDRHTYSKCLAWAGDVAERHAKDIDLRRSQISAWRAVGRTPSFRVQATLVTAWQGDLWGSVPECVLRRKIKDIVHQRHSRHGSNAPFLKG